MDSQVLRLNRPLKSPIRQPQGGWDGPGMKKLQLNCFMMLKDAGSHFLLSQIVGMLFIPLCMMMSSVCGWGFIMTVLPPFILTFLKMESSVMRVDGGEAIPLSPHGRGAMELPFWT